MKKITCTLIISFLCSYIVHSQSIEESRTFKGITKVNINTSAGEVTLKKASGNDVEVALTYTYPKEKFDPVMDQDGSTLYIKEEFNGSTISGNSFWELTVPDDIKINFTSGSGGLIANDVNLTTNSRIGSGDVEFNNVSGNHSVHTGSGQIDFDQVTGTYKLNSGSGDVDMEQVNGELDVNVGSGNVYIDGSQARLSVNVGSGDIKGTEINLTGASSFNSGSGNAKITLSNRLESDISVNSGSGDAILDFDGNDIEGTITMEANKSNGRIIAPFKFDKEEEDGYSRNVKLKKTVKIGNSQVKIRVSTGSGRAEISK